MLLHYDDQHHQQHHQQQCQPTGQEAMVGQHQAGQDSSNLQHLLLYTASIIVISLTVLNAALLHWIVVSLQQDRATLGHTDGHINLMEGRLELHGQSVFNQDVVVARIESKEAHERPPPSTVAGHQDGAPHMEFISESNITFASGGQQQISLTPSGLIDTGTRVANITIESSQSSRLLVGPSGVMVAAHKLIATNRAGLNAMGHSVQTEQVSGQDSLSFHSSTQMLTLFTPRSLSMESSNGSLNVEASERVTVRSRRGSVIFDSALVDVTNVRTIGPSQSGRTYPNLYKLCYCHVAPGSPSHPSPEPASNSNAMRRHPKLGLLFAVRPSLNCSSFSWFCNKIE